MNAEKSERRICMHCRWVSVYGSYCGAPENVASEATDLVTGLPRYAYHFDPRPKDLRANEAACGPSGKWHKPRAYIQNIEPEQRPSMPKRVAGWFGWLK